jgi:hypothetical protein
VVPSSPGAVQVNVAAVAVDGVAEAVTSGVTNNTAPELEKIATPRESEMRLKLNEIKPIERRWLVVTDSWTSVSVFLAIGRILVRRLYHFLPGQATML